MDYKNIILNKQDGIAYLILNKPNVLNALCREVLTELDNAIDDVQTDKSVNILIITGNGKAFAAGADISEMQNMTPDEARNFSRYGQKIFRKIELLEKPVIAAVNGFALGGGCELAMSCDIRFASDKAKFGQPEINLGVIPGFAGTQRLARIAGMAKAKELLFTGNMFDAYEAEKIGLVNKVIASEELLSETQKFAEIILSKPINAIKHIKAAVNRGYETDMETGTVIENNLFSLCFTSPNQKEGMTAFLEKRKAEFVNK